MTELVPLAGSDARVCLGCHQPIDEDGTGHLPMCEGFEGGDGS